MDLWHLLDVIALGPSLLTVDGTLSLEEARQRLLVMAGPQVIIASVPRLVVSLRDDRVEASYSVASSVAESKFLTAWSAMETVRPVFRGRLSMGPDGRARLSGWFGLEPLVRILGALSVLIGVVLITAGFIHVPIGWGAFAWVIPFVFLLAVLFCRANSDDDIRLIRVNLQHALNADV